MAVVTIDVVGGPHCGEQWHVPKSNGEPVQFMDVPAYDTDGVEIEWHTYGLARLDEGTMVRLVWLYLGVKDKCVQRYQRCFDER